MTKGTHLLRSALLALLALAVISGGSLAADLFDDDYDDCPYQTRLRDGQIADLAVARDSDDADHVNVSWSATEAATWGLGSNSFSTSLVVLLDDDDDGDFNDRKTLQLGSRKVTFEGVDTGKTVKVQMAIVVDHADGNYLISDILEMSINQSLSKPAFSSAWHQVSGVTLPTRTGKAADLKISSTAVAGMMYYIGYNENFGNYKSSDNDLVTSPATARLRIGLAHSAEEDNDDRDTVDFDAYIIRIVGEDGDVIDEGNDVATMESSYKSDRTALSFNHDANGETAALSLTAPTALFLDDVTQDPTFNPGTSPAKGTIGTGGYALTNVRIVDGDKITVAAHNSSAVLNRASERVEPDTEPLSIVRVDSYPLTSGNVTDATGEADATYNLPDPLANGVFAAAPAEHRDFPMDTMTSDETYTISAWAVNDKDEVISPVVEIKVRPRDTAQGTVTGFRDYKVTTAAVITDLTTTEFTVLK